MQKPCDLDFCTNSGSLVCTACKSARYCCREHQRQAWPMHRSVCKVAAAHGELKTRLASGELAEAEAGCQRLSVLSADATKVHELTAAGTLEALVGALLRHGALSGHLNPNPALAAIRAGEQGQVYSGLSPNVRPASLAPAGRCRREVPSLKPP